MDWTKVKPKHFLFSDLTLANKGALITLLCLTAQLERIPNNGEIAKVLRQSSYTSVTKALHKCNISVTEVLQKVVEDVEKVQHKRNISRTTSKTYREKTKKSDTSHDATDKSRVDKIREDYTKLFELLWEKYPKKDGKKSALRHFKSSVKTKQDTTDIIKALDNYLKSEVVSKGFIKNGSTWFNNWQDWVNYKEEKKLNRDRDTRPDWMKKQMSGG